jgi:hypothetical protein
VAHKGHHRKPDPIKVCMVCGETVVRRYRPSGKIESYQDFLTRKYCSRQCATTAISLGFQVIRETRGEPVVVLPLAEVTV